MSALEWDRVYVFSSLRWSVREVRDIANNAIGPMGNRLRLFADEMAKDVAEIEAELIAAGYLPRPANEA
jgi:hypothetical protein